jgi:hypothetical protein
MEIFPSWDKVKEPVGFYHLNINPIMRGTRKEKDSPVHGVDEID